MAQVFGEELKKQIEKDIARINEIQEERRKRIENCWVDDSDCFMSARVEDQTLRRHQMELEILKGDGCMDYEAIFDQDGVEVGVHEFMNQWRRISYVGRGIFASSIKALLKKTGWTKKTIRVPAWVKFDAGSGGGMCAVYTGRYIICRWHTNMVTGEYVGYPK